MYQLSTEPCAYVAQLVKNSPAMQETWVWSLVRKIPWRRERLPTPVFWPREFHRLYSPWGGKESDTTERLNWTELLSLGKETACNSGYLGLILSLGQPFGEGKGYPLQYSWASLVAQLIKNSPTMWETWVWFLGWEDLLEKGKALLTPVFWPREFHRLYSPLGHKESDTTEQLS